MPTSSQISTHTRMLAGTLVCTATLLVSVHHTSEAQQKHHDHTSPHHAGATCHGFVILPNGFAVLSDQAATAPHGQAGSQASSTSSAKPMVAPGHGAGGAPSHLMGYTHGQTIAPTRDMLCVPTGEASAQTWQATGQHEALAVTVESLKGALTRSNRSSASFALTVQQSGAAVDTADIRVLVRMPHHDRRMQGGHGPANDPDVKGIPAQAAGAGRYTIPLVDFTMSGPWLFEIQVQRGPTRQTVYIAPTISEE